MLNSKKLWLWLGAIFVLSFAILGLLGREIYVKAPPVPERVVTTQGTTIYTKADIQMGREVWQTLGGMELGSVWGHGGYVAPDWGADWLHREATALLDLWSRKDFGKTYATLNQEQQAGLRQRLLTELRPNRYDPATGTITISPERAQVIAGLADHYAKLFSSDPSLRQLRVQYAIPERSLIRAEDRAQLASFFFWTAWSSVTQRPGEAISYTSNWPHDPLVGNTPAPALGCGRSPASCS